MSGIVKAGNIRRRLVISNEYTCVPHIYYGENFCHMHIEDSSFENWLFSGYLLFISVLTFLMTNTNSLLLKTYDHLSGFKIDSGFTFLKVYVNILFIYTVKIMRLVHFHVDFYSKQLVFIKESRLSLTLNQYWIKIRTVWQKKFLFWQHHLLKLYNRIYS